MNKLVVDNIEYEFDIDVSEVQKKLDELLILNRMVGGKEQYAINSSYTEKYKFKVIHLSIGRDYSYIMVKYREENSKNIAQRVVIDLKDSDWGDDYSGLEVSTIVEMLDYLVKSL